MRDLSTSSNSGLHPFAADTSCGARMFSYCLFDHRLRTRNIKQANQQAGESFLEIHSKKTDIYKKTSFVPRWTLRRTLATIFSSLLGQENIQRRGRPFLMLGVFKCRAKMEWGGLQSISPVWGDLEISWKTALGRHFGELVCFWILVHLILII